MVMTKEMPRASAGSSGAQHCTKFKTGKLLSPLFFCVIASESRTDLVKKGSHHEYSPAITHAELCAWADFVFAKEISNFTLS